MLFRALHQGILKVVEGVREVFVTDDAVCLAAEPSEELYEEPIHRESLGVLANRKHLLREYRPLSVGLRLYVEVCRVALVYEPQELTQALHVHVDLVSLGEEELIGSPECTPVAGNQRAGRVPRHHDVNGLFAKRVRLLQHRMADGLGELHEFRVLGHLDETMLLEVILACLWPVVLDGAGQSCAKVANFADEARHLREDMRVGTDQRPVRRLDAEIPVARLIKDLVENVARPVHGSGRHRGVPRPARAAPSPSAGRLWGLRMGRP
mmetsp:Transcript_13404/g.36059  ORF Transcript_13404/g.36059 Transcript_13404/m.36059 type:complete len:266 (-) Transcript_13404:8-805(-)